MPEFEGWFRAGGRDTAGAPRSRSRLRPDAALQGSGPVDDRLPIGFRVGSESGCEVTVEDDASARRARLLLDRGLAVPRLAPLGPFGVGRLTGVPGVGELTVVVPVKDRPEALDRLLRALGPALPVIVVDDGSTGPTIAEVAREAGALVVRQATSRGLAAARSSGLTRVRTPFVAVVEPDVEPLPGWLETLLPHFADPALGLVAPRVVGARVDGRGASYRPSVVMVARTAALGAGPPRDWQLCEDAGIVRRLIEAGWRVRYEPAARVVHVPAPKAGG